MFLVRIKRRGSVSRKRSSGRAAGEVIEYEDKGFGRRACRFLHRAMRRRTPLPNRPGGRPARVWKKSFALKPSVCSLRRLIHWVFRGRFISKKQMPGGSEA